MWQNRASFPVEAHGGCRVVGSGALGFRVEGLGFRV